MSPLIPVVIGVMAVVAGSAFGLHRLERHVLARDSFRPPPVLEFVGAPDGIRADLLVALEPVRQTAWSDTKLCRWIGELLEADPWVRRVRAVRKYGDGRIEIRCDYRRPAVMIPSDGLLYLVSQDQVRLPGTYMYEPGLLLVEGIASAPPPAGEVWAAPELNAAIRLADRLAGEPFCEQITGVLVHNYGGRIDSEEAHIRLATDRAGGTIIWGSAPGEELEENSVAEKIAILRENYRRFGRVDANRRMIDISIHPNRFTTPA